MSVDFDKALVARHNRVFEFEVPTLLFFNFKNSDFEGEKEVVTDIDKTLVAIKKVIDYELELLKRGLIASDLSRLIFVFAKFNRLSLPRLQQTMKAVEIISKNEEALSEKWLAKKSRDERQLPLSLQVNNMQTLTYILNAIMNHRRL
jgi:hypothetical protein